MLKESIDLHRQGRFDEAEQGYRAQLAQHPDDADTLHLLGMLRYQCGDAAEGAQLLGRARELAPNDANIELAIASLAFRKADYVAAESGFKRALELDPNLGGAHAGIGQIALLRGEHAAAEQHFRTALRTGEEPHALAGLGAMLLEGDDTDGALRHISRAADLAPHDAVIQMLLGQAFAKRDTPAFAQQAFENALRLQPDLHQARLWLGGLLTRTRRFPEANEHYRSLLAVPGLEANAHIGLADVARAENRLEDAVASYRSALALQPDQILALRALAQSLAQLGRADEGLALYEARLARIDDSDGSVHEARAVLLSLLGRAAQAADDLKIVLERNPDNLQARVLLARLSESIGQYDDASHHAAIVASALPQAPEMLLIQVRALLRHGDAAGARTVLETLGRMQLSETQSRLCWNHLGSAHDLTGEAEHAVNGFVEAQRGMPSALPALADPHPGLREALARPVGDAWANAPTLLLGAPGSGVDRIAALLADHPELQVLRDRFGATIRDDDFSLPHFAHYCGDLSDADRAELRERYVEALRKAGVDPTRPIVDWLPRWDAHLLALIRRAMPGARLVIVEADPRDTLLNWLAFGWGNGFPCPDPDTAADWLLRLRTHLHFASELDEPRRLVVDSAALLADPTHAGAELARFVGVDALQPGDQLAAMAHGLGGLPRPFPAGHWQLYREALAGPFDRLRN
ncbi:MAG: tetratricopeptide repeat protein [Dokdonella sp.]